MPDVTTTKTSDYITIYLKFKGRTVKQVLQLLSDHHEGTQRALHHEGWSLSMSKTKKWMYRARLFL